MTKKDYELIAKTFMAHVPTMGDAGSVDTLIGMNTMHKHLARTMAKNLALENPRFDRTKFLAACGIKED